MTENDFRKELNKRANSLNSGECIIHLENRKDRTSYNVFTGDTGAMLSIIALYLAQLTRDPNDNKGFEEILDLLRETREYQLTHQQKYN